MIITVFKKHRYNQIISPKMVKGVCRRLITEYAVENGKADIFINQHQGHVKHTIPFGKRMDSLLTF